ncbi:hypothetical protein KA047_03650, partial [Candidatus Saccharibacteria bacterium]|nr:hypothetical protein [Candidatus Saccharibacteria bacterium]
MNEVNPQEQPVHIDAVAASIERALRISEIVFSENYDETPEGRAAVDAAYRVADTMLEAVSDEEALDILNANADLASEEAKLRALRKSMLELELSVVDVDQRLHELDKKVPTMTNLVAARLVVRALSNLTNTTETLEYSIDTPGFIGEDDETDAAEADKQRRTIPIGFDIDEKSGMPAVYIGSRRIKLATKESSLRHAAPKFAALSVMTELMDGEQISVNELWTRMFTSVLDEEHAPVLDKDVMRNVREFLTNLTYRQQQMFVHNNKRGLSSAYEVNPELKYDIVIGAESDDDVKRFAQQLVERGVATPEVEQHPQAAPVSLDKHFAPIETFDAEANNEPAVPAVTEIIDAPIDQPADTEHDSVNNEIVERFAEVMPSQMELYAFLSKIYSAMPNFAALEAIPESSMLHFVFDIVEGMLDCLEENFDQADTDRLEANISLDALRSEVADKLISLTENDALLNDLAENNIADIFGELYGENLGVFGEMLIDTILDMDAEETAQLRELIAFNPSTRIIVDNGSFSSGVTIVGVEYDTGDEGVEMPRSTIEDEIEVVPTVPTESVEPVEQVEDTPAVETEVVSEPAVEQNNDDIRDERIEHTPASPEAIEVPETRTKSKAELQEQHIRAVVGRIANQLLAAGFGPGNRYSSRQLEN